MYYGRTKYIEIRYYFIREKVIEELIKLVFILIKEKATNDLIKPLIGEVFVKFI